MTMAEDPYLDCPLDNIHRIRKSRMQVHLVRCLKNYPLIGKMKCPYNPLHIVDALELTHHCQECEDNASVQLREFDLEQKCFSGEVSLDEVQKKLDAVMSENNEWDTLTINAPAYDPTRNIESKPIRRVLQCESKAKKREFRLKERQRFNAIENATSGSDGASTSAVVHEAAGPKPLRLPRTALEQSVKINKSPELPVHSVVQHFDDKKVKNETADQWPIERNILKVKQSDAPSNKLSFAAMAAKSTSTNKSTSNGQVGSIGHVNNSVGQGNDPTSVVMKRLEYLTLTEKKLQKEKTKLMKTLKQKLDGDALQSSAEINIIEAEQDEEIPKKPSGKMLGVASSATPTLGRGKFINAAAFPKFG